jgi:hypothetical protein
MGKASRQHYGCRKRKMSKSSSLSLVLGKKQDVVSINMPGGTNKLKYYALHLENGKKMMQHSSTSAMKIKYGARFIRLPAKMRKNIQSYLERQEDVSKCAFFRCYSFVVLASTNQFPVCDLKDKHNCQHSNDEMENMFKLVSSHFKKNFTSKVVERCRIGDILAFITSNGDAEHFGIDMGISRNPADNGKRLCLSKLGTYSELYLTTHEELHRLYSTNILHRLTPVL